MSVGAAGRAPLQVSGPLYKLAVTELGGEQRFAAAVARRLQSLGALTRGDRRAASGQELNESNLDTPLGRKALRKLYDALTSEPPAARNPLTFVPPRRWRGPARPRGPAR